MHKEKRRLNKTKRQFFCCCIHLFISSVFLRMLTMLNSKAQANSIVISIKKTVLIRLYLWHCSFYYHQMRHTMRFFSVLTKMCSILLRLKCAASHCARKWISSKVGILSICSYIDEARKEKKMCHPNRIDMKVMCASTWSTLYSQSLSSVTLDAF